MADEIKFFSLLKDSTIKYMLKNERTRDFFLDIIKYYTDLDLKDYTLIDNEKNSGGLYADFRLDILLQSPDKNTLVNIEVNGENRSYILPRNRMFLHRVAGNFIKSGEGYTALANKFVKQVNINDFLCNEDHNIITNSYMLSDDQNNIKIENFKIHNIYLPKAKNSCYNEMGKKIRFLRSENYEDMRKIAGEDQEMLNIMEELKRLSEDPYFGRLYYAEEDRDRLMITEREEGFQEGQASGINIGEENKSIEVAKKMKEENLDIELISKITGLTIQEIEKL